MEDHGSRNGEISNGGPNQTPEDTARKLADPQRRVLRKEMKRQKYRDGTEIHVGDRVFYHGQAGRIVILAGQAEYAPDYPKEEWPTITSGAMIHFDNGARLRFDLPDDHFSKDKKESMG